MIPHSFVANFVSYIFAKYYLNWFSFYIIIMEVIGVDFFETQCTVYVIDLYHHHCILGAIQIWRYKQIAIA